LISFPWMGDVIAFCFGAKKLGASDCAAGNP
jgi:hypothetical protein